MYIDHMNFKIIGKQINQNGVIQNDDIWLVVRSLKNADGKIVKYS